MTIKRNWRRKPGNQNGYVMLGLITVLGIAAITVFVSSLNATGIRTEQERKTTSALALAKLALIGRAASDDDRPGSLRCRSR